MFFLDELYIRYCVKLTPSLLISDDRLPDINCGQVMDNIEKALVTKIVTYTEEKYSYGRTLLHVCLETTVQIDSSLILNKILHTPGYMSAWSSSAKSICYKLIFINKYIDQVVEAMFACKDVVGFQCTLNRYYVIVYADMHRPPNLTTLACYRYSREVRSSKMVTHAPIIASMSSICRGRLLYELMSPLALRNIYKCFDKECVIRVKPLKDMITVCI